jgi:chromosome segregation ATPase
VTFNKHAGGKMMQIVEKLKLKLEAEHFIPPSREDVREVLAALAEKDRNFADLFKERNGLKKKIAGLEAHEAIWKPDRDKLVKQSEQIAALQDNIGEYHLEEQDLNKRIAALTSERDDWEKKAHTVSTAYDELYEKCESLESQLGEVRKEAEKYKDGLTALIKWCNRWKIPFTLTTKETPAGEKEASHEPT